MTTLIEKSILNERLEKSRSGIYADTSENRRKHRVGQKYGSEKKEEEKPEKTDPNKMSPEQQLEAINKVIAAINEGKLKLPPEEINTLVAKKTMAEEAVKQAKGEKKSEKKEEPLEGKEFFTVSESDVKNLKKEFDNVLNGVDLSKQNSDDIKETLRGIASDFLKKNYEEAENKAAKAGNRDFNLLNSQRDKVSENIIFDYISNLNLNKRKVNLDEDKGSSTVKEKVQEEPKKEATKPETKAEAAASLSPMLKQYYDLKAKYPNALLLCRSGDFYHTYSNDAEKAAKILGITLTRSNRTKDIEGKPLGMAGFPSHALDIYLPKLIRAGERVAIYDQLEAPKERTRDEKIKENEAQEEPKKEATKPEAKSEGKKEDKINQKPNTYITPENSEGYVRNLNKLLDTKGYFAHATRTGGIEIYKKGDRKSLGNLKASIIATDYISWGPNENLKDMLEPLIKEALSSAPSILDKLIDISVDFNKEDLKSLDDKSLNELKDKLREKYNKEDKLERRAFKRHRYFTANPESAKYDDRLRAVENEIKKRAESKNEPEKNEKPEPKQEASGKASDPIYQVQQKKKEASKRYDSKREEARQKYDKEADEIRSEIDKLYESDHPDAAKKRKELWNTLKEKTNKYDAETTRLKDEYEAEYKKLDEAEDKLYDQRQKEETSEEVKESYTRVKFEDVPNSGKVNLKKYLSDKVKRTADENLGILSKVSTENLKKMEAGLVKEFNSQFDDLSKSRRAEKLYSIMKVKAELAKRGNESQKKE